MLCDVTLSVYPHRAGLTRPDRVAQLAERWASIPKVVGSNPTVARHIFQACPVWIYTQSNITQHLRRNNLKLSTTVALEGFLSIAALAN